MTATLTAPPLARQSLASDSSIDARFRRFHNDHPEVYVNLVAFARRWKATRGAERMSIGMLWEVLRWETALGDPSAEFRLNDHYRSRYARLIMGTEPDLKDCFHVRSLRTV